MDEFKKFKFQMFGGIISEKILSENIPFKMHPPKMGNLLD